MCSNNTNYEACMNRVEFHEEVRKFSLSLYENPSVPRNEVQSIIEKVGTFMGNAYSTYIKNELDRVMKNNLDDVTQGKVDTVFDNSKNPFQDFSTEHLRFEQYKKECLFFEPEEFEIGRDIETGDPVNGIHISLIKSLRVFLQLPGVYKSMKEYMKSVENEKDIIYNVTQGKLWQSKYRKDGRNAFPFFVSFDDMQPGNTLGSHASQQVLGMVYGSLPCLPPHLVSKLTNVFLLTVFNSKHRSNFGNAAVFTKLKEELNELSLNGITINVDGIKETVYFDCLLLIGDNLGMNSCCGFSESFSAHYYCRICHASKEECKKMTQEDPSLIRNKKSYQRDLVNRSRGVKEKCFFNELHGFHITQNHCLDLMHDVFEGIGRDEIEYILTVFVLKKKLFTLAELNKKIAQFDYGNESTNKPVPLTIETCQPCDKKRLGTNTKIKAKQSAAEMACLIRYLGPILDDLIPLSEDLIEYWALYIRLRQIVGIVSAPRFAMSDIKKVEELIHNHHTLYIKLFGNLKPKHHMMVHIPRIMLENGPLVHFWAMMYERKHREYKNVAKNVTCSKDMPYTIGLRNQLSMSYKKEFTEELNSDYELGPLKKDHDMKFVMMKYFKQITSIESYNFVELLGNQFKDGTVFLVGIKDDEPEFAKVKNVLKINDDLYLYTSSLLYVDFDYKYYAYEVQNNDVPDHLINIDDVSYTPPGLFSRNKNLKYYISTKYDI